MSKPFMAVYPPELRQLSSHKAKILRIGKTCQDLLLPRVAEKMIGRPECAALVMDLYAGGGFPSPPNTYLPTSIDRPLAVPLRMNDNFDIARIRAIVDYNGFAA